MALKTVQKQLSKIFVTNMKTGIVVFEKFKKPRIDFIVKFYSCFIFLI